MWNFPIRINVPTFYELSWSKITAEIVALWRAYPKSTTGGLAEAATPLNKQRANVPTPANWRYAVFIFGWWRSIRL